MLPEPTTIKSRLFKPLKKTTQKTPPPETRAAIKLKQFFKHQN